ncbi:TetR/AcrR family transcriptional regulator [Geminicoccus harenae]|uniref:TetR/AcrR family transcriptional regulator n=1 Tax=Geminicoccus harenae TaxID=2498453 RepID=UPI00168B7AEC|nr:TetR/AcrR family transcriptional regulator [Geminicoccus harenae]
MPVLVAVRHQGGTHRGPCRHHDQPVLSHAGRRAVALIEDAFSDLLEHFDAEIDALMEQDPDPQGRFTRAYASTLYTKREPQIECRWTALSVSSVADPGLRRTWADSFERRLDRHKETDSGMGLTIIRLAAGGLWLAGLLDYGDGVLADQKELYARLIVVKKTSS